MKISTKTLLRDVDYWDKLSPEEKQFLYEFELKEKYGQTIPGRENLSKDELKKVQGKYYDEQNDYMNTTAEGVRSKFPKRRIKTNLTGKKGSKTRYSPLDYPGMNSEEDDTND